MKNIRITAALAAMLSIFPTACGQESSKAPAGDLESGVSAIEDNMKFDLKCRLLIDAAMSAALLLLMAYGLIGETSHEWIGMGTFVLFILHHVLNRKWIQAVGRGNYTPTRTAQTVLVGAIFLCMLGSMLSGIVISRHVFAFLPKHGGYAWAEPLHLLCAYWGFVLMGLHLGLHWSRMLAIARKHLRPSALRTWCLRLAAWLWALYGAAAFYHRSIGDYLLLKSHFVFYDFSESAARFLLDYLSVMVLFVLIGFYLSRLLHRHQKS